VANCCSSSTPRTDGGLLAATTLTILFVPMFYVVIQRLGEGRLFGRGRRVREEAEGLAETRRPGSIPP
jgi:hypothetical protein